MKKIVHIKRLTALIFILVFAVPILSACNAQPENKGVGYTNEREKYFYGLAEPANSSTDAGQTAEMTLNLAGDMGFKSYRLFMHHSANLVVRNKNENEVSLAPGAEQYYREFIDGLVERGITEITAVSHYYTFPLGFSATGDRTYGAFPEPGSPFYDDFMNLVEKTYYLVAKTFPKIKYFECGNETNASVNCRKPNGDPYTIGEKAQIMADLCFFARHGIKRAIPDGGNPGASLVFPAPIYDTRFNTINGTGSQTNGIIPFLRNVYNKIASGDSPYAELDDNPGLKSVDTDEYFDVMAWHPYAFDGIDDRYIESNLAIYEILEENDDGGKKVFFTELGYCTTRNSLDPEKWAEYEAKQGENIRADLTRIYNELPFVEQVHLFRMFDWNDRLPLQNGDNHDAGYGLFTSPGAYKEGGAAYLNGLSDGFGPRPKRAAIALFRLINGNDAPLGANGAPGLFRYYAGPRPAKWE
ncbi:MAG: hypothetical protein LBH24_00465 [Clostridiales bacterium]|jgi:hypothetical protein|nr:hypothetical protein [Clostridiales bacterium]